MQQKQKVKSSSNSIDKDNIKLFFKKILKKVHGNPNLKNNAKVPFAGEEVFNTIASDIDIFYCFRLILGRFPNREEWKGHSSHVGLDLTKVVKNYIKSLEFANRKMLEPPLLDDVQLVKLDKFSMYVTPSDPHIGMPILTSKMYEPHVTRILNQKLQPGMTVLDIGANIGYFSMLMSNLIGKDGRCIAIEPNPRNVKLMLASKNLNGFEQLQIFQAAAGNTWGILKLYTIFTNGVVSPVNTDANELLQTETVQSLKIDDILPCDERVDLIKIDVEGAEFSALSGALQCIERDHPLIISEFTPGALPDISGVTPEEYLRFFTSRGYNLSVLEPDHIVPCLKDIEMVMKIYREKNVDHIDILAEPFK